MNFIAMLKINETTLDFSIWLLKIDEITLD